VAHSATQTCAAVGRAGARGALLWPGRPAGGATAGWTGAPEATCLPVWLGSIRGSAPFLPQLYWPIPTAYVNLVQRHRHRHPPRLARRGLRLSPGRLAGAPRREVWGGRRQRARLPAAGGLTSPPAEPKLTHRRVCVGRGACGGSPPRAPAAGADAVEDQRDPDEGRARPRGRSAPPLTRFTPDSLSSSVAVFLKRHGDRTPGEGRAAGIARHLGLATRRAMLSLSALIHRKCAKIHTIIAFVQHVQMNISA
jgi:hypothetical protein